MKNTGLSKDVIARSKWRSGSIKREFGSWCVSHVVGTLSRSRTRSSDARLTKVSLTIILLNRFRAPKYS